MEVVLQEVASELGWVTPLIEGAVEMKGFDLVEPYYRGAMERLDRTNESLQLGQTDSNPSATSPLRSRR